ncbi:class II holin family protein [Escherichia coli]|uniref:class II holin family protein n=1 Tax=Escherichia coli TaxID=562 RepID=UPI00336C2CC8
MRQGPSVCAGGLFYCCELPDCGRRGMYQMEKITTGVSYTTSAVERATGSCSCWTGFPRLSGRSIGVLGSLLFGLLTYLTNLYFKIKEDRRKAARGE